MRPMADFLYQNGLTCYGVRLKGHGTSPCDLDFRKRGQWYRSVLRGWEVLNTHCDKIFVVGFSMGGNLAVKLAAEKGNELAGIIAISAPLRIRNKNIIFANLINQINKLAASLPYLNGIKRFKKSSPENPDINYQYIPISAIHQFKSLMDETEDSLGEIDQPILIIQGDGDPTVDPVSAELLFNKVSSRDKKIFRVDDNRHVIVLEKGSPIQREVVDFIRTRK
jgi:esterase/lipase